MIRLLVLMTITGLLAGCSYIPSLDKVLPDNRSDYKKSEPLPDLEVPPDLTAGASSDAMDIPGEGASLSRYQQRHGRSGTGSTAAAEVAGMADESWVSVPGSRADIWPKLEAFFQDRGYGFEVDDQELGVMETAWSEPATGAGSPYRDKFKVFTEPADDPGRTVLFISNERQQRIGEGDAANWVDQGSSSEAEQRLAAAVQQQFNGSRSTRVANASSSMTGGTGAMAERKLARLEDAGDDKVLLALPEELTLAWRHTETALERAGFEIVGRDQEKGQYYINYYDRSADKEEGWLSKLAFWRDNEPEAVPYVLSLTGAGNRTELVVLNEKGDWQTGGDADKILRIVRDEYNRL